MTTYTVRVGLSQDFRRTAFGYDAQATYAFVEDLFIEADSALGACNVAFAITNSYPEELHCDAAYASQVAAYRDGKNRSLSVGDVLLVTDGESSATYACASAGWDAVGD